MPARLIAFDTETEVGTPWQAGIAAPKLICGSFCEQDEKPFIRDADATISEIGAMLSENGCIIIGANLAFDVAVTCAADPSLIPLWFAAYEQGRVRDVLIRQALDAIANGHLYLRPDGGHLTDPETGKRKDRYSLAICAQLQLGKVLEKKDTWRMSYAKLQHLPLAEWPQEARDYALDDAQTTLDVYLSQEGMKNLHDEPSQCRAALALHLSSVWGMRTDAVKVAEVTERVTREFAVEEKRFQEIGFIRADGSQDMEVIKARIVEAYKGNPPLTDPTEKMLAKGVTQGNVKTDKLTKEESGDDQLEEFALMGENRTLKQTFLETVQLGTIVPINPGTNVLVDTGRTSYYKPNLQNLPRKGGIRECFRARKGYVFGFVDFSGVELCTLAQSCLWWGLSSSMAEALNAGKDLHSDLASQLAGKSYTEIIGLLKSGDKKAEDLRQASKAANFGFPGGMGPAKFVLTKRKEGLRICLSMGLADKVAGALTCGVEKLTEWNGRDIPPTCARCLEGAQSLKDGWLNHWPEMRHRFARISHETESGSGTCVQQVSLRERANCTYTEYANSFFQGLAADMAKHALWLVTEECYTDRKSPLWNCRPVVFVHDEIGIELVESRASEALDRVVEVMTGEPRQKYCPDVLVKAEGALCRNWWKGAKQVKVGGLTVPVKPEMVDGKKTWIEDRG